MDPTVLQQTPLQPSPGIGDGSKSERTPLALRVFGALLMAGGVAVVPEVIHTLAQMGTVFVEKTYTDDSLLTIILYVTLALSACFCALASGVLGFRLLRGNRRRARLIAEAVAIGLVVAFSADLLLFGVNPGLWFLGACALILIAAHVWVDPSLSDERELQRRLRLMQTREEAEDGTLGLDKTGRGYIELDFFNLFWIFVIASVAGVVIESIYHVLVVDFGHYEDRAGLLWGPFSPIYGFGAVLMTLALNRFHNAPIPVVFLISAVIGGAFEYFVSWFMQFSFGITAWDYTGTFLSIDGRTNGQFMAMWGVMGVIWIRLILPIILKLVNKIPWNWRYAVTTVCAVLMLADALLTLSSLDCWYQREAGTMGETSKTVIDDFCNKHYSNEFMQNRFQSMSMDTSEATRIN